MTDFKFNIGDLATYRGMYGLAVVEISSMYFSEDEGSHNYTVEVVQVQQDNREYGPWPDKMSKWGCYLSPLSALEQLAWAAE